MQFPLFPLCMLLHSFHFNRFNSPAFCCSSWLSKGTPQRLQATQLRLPPRRETSWHRNIQRMTQVPLEHLVRPLGECKATMNQNTYHKGLTWQLQLFAQSKALRKERLFVWGSSLKWMLQQEVAPCLQGWWTHIFHGWTLVAPLGPRHVHHQGSFLRSLRLMVIVEGFEGPGSQGSYTFQDVASVFSILRTYVHIYIYTYRHMYKDVFINCTLCSLFYVYRIFTV